MGLLIRISLLAVSAAMLVSCASTGLARLEPGKSSEAELRQALGEPARVFTLPDGSRQLAFPENPEGTRTYMAFLSPNGRLDRVEQVLTEQQFRLIERGTSTRDDIDRLIGPPWRVVDFPNKRQVAWDYVYQDSWGYTVDFSVMFDERGIVAETANVRRDPGDGGMN
jgi:outer membrane protein assembly factor BamE (lipoprotein component of BamABCDE complex)